jgi:hypothetical protein
VQSAPGGGWRVGWISGEIVLVQERDSSRPWETGETQSRLEAQDTGARARK